MNILLLRGFNNYFNRIVKKYSTLEDYRTESSSYLDLDNINFNPNDGVATELIIGSTNQKENNEPLDWENIGTPDYLVCYEGDPSEIKSRWFVLESERTRAGQYRIALKRDVLAEHFGTIMSAPCFVEKGYVSDPNSTLLYNKENMTYNQIKQSETLLKDETGCGWIIGYASQDKKPYPETGYYSSNARLDEAPNRVIDWDDIPSEIKTNYLSSMSAGGNNIYYDDTVKISDIRLNPVVANFKLKDSNHYVQIEFGATIVDQRTGTQKGYLKYYDTFLNSTYIPTKPIEADTFLNSTYIPTKPIEAGNYEISYGVASATCWQATATTAGTNNWGTLLKFSTGMNDSVWFNQYTYQPVFFDRTGSGASLRTLGKLFEKINNRKFKRLYFEQFNKKYQDNTQIAHFAVFLNNYDYIRRGNRLYRISYEEELFDAPEEEYWDIPRNIVIYQPKYNESKTLPQLASELSGTGSTEKGVFEFRSLRAVNRVVKEADILETAIEDTVNSGIRWRYSKYRHATIRLVGVEETEVRTRMDSTRQQCYDCNTDIFCIPYSDGFTFKDGNNVMIMSKQVALQAAMALGQAGNNVYDIQLLPYYPDRSAVGIDEASIAAGFIYNETVDLTLFTEHVDFEYILNSNDEKIGAYFWSRVSSGEFDIKSPIQLSDLTNTMARKVSNETDVYRVVSPNFNGQFEFSLAKSNGKIDFFNVDYTYKPFNPYIHVSPALSGLYGENFISLDDARGLVCGGDFSMARVTSAWEQYQLNNKNYQEIFDRGIKNMDVNNQIAREQQEFSGIMGILTGGAAGAAGGAMAGAKIGGGYGAVAGAVVGGGSGLIGGLMGYEKDKEWLARQQAENRSYAIDMYGYQLGNIQALPYSLVKTSAFTKNNRIFPFVEYYSSTYEETEILRNKIKYDGMTIMALGQLQNYISSPFEKTYVKGRMVRLEDLDDDFHIADAVYAEVNKGFYIPKEGE